MSEEYPLYPTLTEEGKREADLWLQKFCDKMKKVAEEVVSETYSSCVEYIESDSWSNFRNELLDGFKNYNNRKIQAEYDFSAIRAEIYKQFRDEIIVDLNQDLVKENEELKERIKYMEEYARRSLCWKLNLWKILMSSRSMTIRVHLASICMLGY